MNHRGHALSICAAMLLMATAAACDHAMPEVAAPIEQPRSCITLGPAVTPNSATLHPGDTLRARVTANACGAPSASHFRWLTSNATVATVDSLSGLITARAQGAATIIAEMVEDTSVKGAMVVQVNP